MHLPSGPDPYTLHKSSSARYNGEDPSLARDQSSTDSGDLELGNAPLLPSDSLAHHDSELDSNFDIEEHCRNTRRDPPFSCSRAGFVAWCKGPDPPHVYRVNSWFPKWQAAPARLVERGLPKGPMKMAALLGGLLFWVVVFFSLLKMSVADQEVLGYGQPVKLSCHQRLWNNATDCGVNGELCLPFEDQSFAFRCPSGCAAAILLEPYNVGEREYNYRPQVIGGEPSRPGGYTSGLYRGDSSICASALHAGLISDAMGGCGILHRHVQKSNFENVTQNGIESIRFLPHFPMSFMLSRQASSPGLSETKLAECSDSRWSLFAFTLAVTTALSMTVSSASAFYSAIYFIVWFQVAMASDPPTSSFYDRVSVCFGRFIPGAFVGFVLYYFCVKYTLGGLDAHVEKTILWLGGCWVGALNTDTFDHIPISRFTLHDIQQQPGAFIALLIIISSLIVITFVQAYCFRREGRFFPMLRLYALLVLGVLILALIPYMNLRIHHDLLALLLLPGTSMQTRASLLFQGILVGLYINGVARWGFGSILQTPASLLDGAKLGTAPPVINPPRIEHQNRLVFSFPDLPGHVDGISVLINDVLRFRSLKSNNSQDVAEFVWHRGFANEIEYFRFGYVHAHALGGVWYEDFTEPATWAVDGSFS
ncbi:uncharacterized protein N7498_009047 [Penicillium cinerascens]|uniref:LCCL domain-containing protein n=1 Tax=Penicillium cinerascens TaxID=70096 RepID=A0A9W9MBD6_9EURO|nr:uncharacterized protein N7498_009047 [Penicillium cinerascens]KAJ5195609.1 hypothetical protein N7498_009047 [Penicillium cinerascens]